MVIMTEGKPVAIRVDARGRISLPGAFRKALGLNPGDTVFARRVGERVELIKSDNPFDSLARYAVKEFKEGKTVTLEEWAEREGVFPVEK